MLYVCYGRITDFRDLTLEPFTLGFLRHTRTYESVKFSRIGGG